MENASKALIFIASTLIAIMILSFMVYMFRRFGATARSTEKRYSVQEIQAFNSKFVNYETEGSHSLDDTISITYYRGRVPEGETINYSYREVFNRSNQLSAAGNASHSKFEETRENYHKALVGTAHNLNKVTDVVTAINDAIDINYRNNNSYRYDYLETQNSVEIIVDLGAYKNDFKFNPSHFQYLVIEPNQNVKSKTIYAIKDIEKSGTNTNNKEKNVRSRFSTTNAISVYDMLDELRSTEIVMVDSKDYMVYQYYFFGEVFVNETTDQIETVKFTLVKDNKFGTKITVGTTEYPR